MGGAKPPLERRHPFRRPPSKHGRRSPVPSHFSRSSVGLGGLIRYVTGYTAGAMALGGHVGAALEGIVGRDGLVVTPEGRMTYECDMHTFYKGAPDAVVLPTRTDQVQEIVRLCRAARVPIVPRGSGTGLIGGGVGPQGGGMVGINRRGWIVEIDLPNRCATVQPGLINLWLSNAVGARGWFFAPDPSSQMVSSIGGNVSTNAGGPHCLKYGITTNHVLGLEMVTGHGELVTLGGKAVDGPGYDLTGVVVGSEGTCG